MFQLVQRPFDGAAIAIDKASGPFAHFRSKCLVFNEFLQRRLEFAFRLQFHGGLRVFEQLRHLAEILHVETVQNRLAIDGGFDDLEKYMGSQRVGHD